MILWDQKSWVVTLLLLCIHNRLSCRLHWVPHHNCYCPWWSSYSPVIFSILGSSLQLWLNLYNDLSLPFTAPGFGFFSWFLLFWNHYYNLGCTFQPLCRGINPATLIITLNFCYLTFHALKINAIQETFSHYHVQELAWDADLPPSGPLFCIETLRKYLPEGFTSVLLISYQLYVIFHPQLTSNHCPSKAKISLKWYHTLLYHSWFFSPNWPGNTDS